MARVCCSVKTSRRPKAPFPATDVSIPNSSYGFDSGNLDTTNPPSAVTPASFSHDEINPANSSHLRSPRNPTTQAQPTDTQQSDLFSFLLDAQPEATSQSNHVIKRDPGLNDVDEDAWKRLPTGSDGIEHTGDISPPTLSGDGNAYLSFISGSKVEDIKNEELSDGDRSDEDIYDTTPLTSIERLAFQRHTSGITVNEMKWKQPGSYLRYTADMTRSPISFEFNWKMIKGFSKNHEGPFAYRRNYFKAMCSFKLPGFWCPTNVEYIEPGSTQAVPIHGFAIGISALQGKSRVKLYQFTAKRDKGKKGRPKIKALSVKKPQLQYYDDDADADADNGGLYRQGTKQRAWEYTYDRLQFSKATPNNGRRKAKAKKYFRVRVSLYIKTESETCTEIAYRDSAEVTVRGRSPLHYKQQDQEASANRSSQLVNIDAASVSFPYLKFESEEEILYNMLGPQQSNDYSSLLSCDGVSFPDPNFYPKIELQEPGLEEVVMPMDGIQVSQQSNRFFDGANINLPPINLPFGDSYAPDLWTTSMIPEQITYSNFRAYREGNMVPQTWVP